MIKKNKLNINNCILHGQNNKKLKGSWAEEHNNNNNKTPKELDIPKEMLRQKSEKIKMECRTTAIHKVLKLNIKREQYKAR